MGIRIRTNIASLKAQRNLANATDQLSASSNKLASGKRINKSADDAAGLAIATGLEADVRSLNQAKRNASDGVALVQTAEGGLAEASSMLIRLRELAIQGASDTIGNKEREFIDLEFVGLKNEIDRIAAATEFNGTRLLIGNADVPDEIANPDDLFPLQIQVGKDYFEDIDNVESEAPVNVIKIDLQNLNSFTSGEGSLDIGKGEDGARVTTRDEAQSSIMKMDSAIERVSEYRAYLGSIQNRLESTISNLSVQSENLLAAKSRVEDTDFAVETAKFTSSQILQQAGSSVLSQANQIPQLAISLVNQI
ncbi:MAG: flagellin FliC [Pseudobacteriovorax sp.]|nr:flagellin FliC [Pseudobacteriovorax sp.]